MEKSDSISRKLADTLKPDLFPCILSFPAEVTWVHFSLHEEGEWLRAGAASSAAFTSPRDSSTALDVERD